MASGLGRFGQDVSAYLLLIIGISTLGPLQFGFHLGALNAPQDVITCAKKSISLSSLLLSLLRRSNNAATTPSMLSLPDCIPMTDAQFAIVSSIFTVGGLIGALAAGPITSSRGRLVSMRLTGALYVLGSLIETVAGSIPILALGRLIVGVGAGGSTVIVPLYISEVSPPASRGFFGAFTQISINVGILIVQTLGFFLSYGSAWRWILATGVFIAAGQTLGSLVMPESPAWLATAKGDVAKAKRTLQRIRGHDVRVDDEVESWGEGDGEELPSEEEGLLARDDGEPGAAPSKRGGSHLGFVEVVKDPLYRPAIIAVVGIMFAQQLCGVNSIIMYSVSLLKDLLPINSALLTIIISAINLVTTMACSPLPDRLGRKTCLLLSIAGQGTSSLALALSIMFGFKILSAISVLLFVAFFAVGLGPVPFIMASELVGQEAVGATQSWSLAANYVATFLVAQFFPIINTALNERFGGAGWVYFIFAAMSVLWGLFVSWRVPETLGKKDADDVWGRARRLD
ncbi:General substrate transporter [Coniochaeta hoffmannii]|uniref:General substrate transporter n=1 Tax=Coniochaeta hoffmannii TaxID=91930 RepID=A0AA38RTU6_9PEZI|nr:General substrate transporter [Coniochaeta hoffmannii]